MQRAAAKNQCYIARKLDNRWSHVNGETLGCYDADGAVLAFQTFVDLRGFGVVLLHLRYVLLFSTGCTLLCTQEGNNYIKSLLLTKCY